MGVRAVIPSTKGQKHMNIYMNMHKNAKGQTNKKSQSKSTRNWMWTHVEKYLFTVGQENYNNFSDTI